MYTDTLGNSTQHFSTSLSVSLYILKRWLLTHQMWLEGIAPSTVKVATAFHFYCKKKMSQIIRELSTGLQKVMYLPTQPIFTALAEIWGSNCLKSFVFPFYFHRVSFFRSFSLRKTDRNSCGSNPPTKNRPDNEVLAVPAKAQKLPSPLAHQRNIASANHFPEWLFSYTVLTSAFCRRTSGALLFFETSGQSNNTFFCETW